MNLPPPSVLLSASASLRVLSKVRSVKNYFFEENVKYHLLRPWPNKFEKNGEVRNWLATKGLSLDEKLRVQAYPVSYSNYRKYNIIQTPYLENIRAERNVLVAMIVAQRPDAVQKIACIWNKEKNPDREHPETTADQASIQKFGQHRDSMLGFKFKENGYYIKIPAFVGEIIFQYAGLFPRFTTIPEDMGETAGSNTDSMNRSKRYIVHQRHTSYLSSVLIKTMESTACFDSISWIEKIRKSSIEFHAQKHT